MIFVLFGRRAPRSGRSRSPPQRLSWVEDDSDAGAGVATSTIEVFGNARELVETRAMSNCSPHTSTRPSPDSAHATMVAATEAPSLGSVGDSFDNAMAESWFATIKIELIYRRVWRSEAR